MKSIIIAIDGHSSCGKSTLAKDLAKELSYIYVDTGAMYRAIALATNRAQLLNNGKITDNNQLDKLLDSIDVSFKQNKNGQNLTMLNNENVEREIRTMEISNIVSIISSIESVRKKLVALQQDMGKRKGIVMDGRDIGTVVFPQAELKIFLTAKPETRAERRFQELIAKGDKVNYHEVLDNIKERDHLDETRAISPLIKAKDAIIIDNSELSREEQLKKALSLVNTL